MTSSSRIALIAALCLGWAGSAFAQPAPPRSAAAPEPAEGEAVVTARRSAESLQRSDRSVYLLRAEEVERRQPRSVPELLHDLPGVSVQMTNRGAGAPFLRGLVGPQNLVLFDGIRLNNSTWRTGPLQYLALLPVVGVERVEVQLGPGGVAYGSDAMGGIVHALPWSMPTRDGARLAAGSRLRTADTSTEQWVRGALRAGPWAVQAAASVGLFGPLRSGGGRILPVGDYQTLAAQVQGWRALAPGVTLGVHAVSAGVLDAGQSHTLPQGSFRRFDNGEHLVYADLRVRDRGPLREARAAISLHVATEQAEQTSCDVRDGLVTDGVACARGVTSVVARRRINDDAVVSPGALAHATFSRGAFTVTTGGDVTTDFVSSTRSTASRPDFALRTGERGNFSDGSRYTAYGVFALGEVRLAGSSPLGARLVAAGGARLSGFNARALGVPGVGDVAYDHFGAAGMASLRFHWGPWFTAYGSWAQGFRAPNLQETTVLGNTGEFFEVPNGALQPERADTFEVGARLRTARVRATAAGWWSEQRDTFVRQLVPAAEWMALGIDPAEVGMLSVVRRINAASGRSYGAEVAVAVGPFAGVTVWGHAAAMRGDVTTSQGIEEPGSRVPPPLGAAGVRWARGALTLELFTRWALSQSRLAPADARDIRICEDRSNPGRLRAPCDGTPGWATLNLRASYRLTPGAALDLMVENVADERYRYHGSGVDEPGLGAMLSLRVGG